ncbi:MAG TPA: hypothetical protein VFG59_10935 [Anaeromyxobacter sp.]|nr:hypothetical protein [Anaeromyxobacter sp.]
MEADFAKGMVVRHVGRVAALEPTVEHVLFAEDERHEAAKRGLSAARVFPRFDPEASAERLGHLPPFALDPVSCRYVTERSCPAAAKKARK